MISVIYFKITIIYFRKRKIDADMLKILTTGKSGQWQYGFHFILFFLVRQKIFIVNSKKKRKKEEERKEGRERRREGGKEKEKEKPVSFWGKKFGEDLLKEHEKEAQNEG